MQDSLRNMQGVSIHDGFPNAAADMSLQGLNLNQLLIKQAASTFLMRITGNEWQATGIFAGDIAIIDKALSPRAGDVVVWWHHDVFAITEYNRLPREAVTWGVVTAVIHQFRRQS